MNADLVSIVIPTYNYGKFLGIAVKSVLNQTFHNIEVIIVDDGSTDNTAVIAQQLMQQDSRVKSVYQHNQGLSAARNTGLRESRGEFVVFLDADDKLHAQKIQAHLEHFSRIPAADISYGRSRYFLSANPAQTFASLDLDENSWMPGISGEATTLLPILIVNNILPVCSAMLRRSVVEKVGFFNTQLKSLEDWDYWIRAAVVGCRFEFSEDERLTALIRVHNASMSKNTLRMLKTEYQMRKILIPAAIAQIKSETLRKKIQTVNTKLKVIRLIEIAELIGIANREFFLLCYGDSFKSIKKAVIRYLKRKSASKTSK